MSDPRIAEIRRYSLNVSWRTTWDFVQVITSTGTSGLGEWSDAGARELAWPYFDAHMGRLVGLTVESALALVEDAAARVIQRSPNSSPRRRRELSVLGGADAALCDLAAQHANMPVSVWLAPDGATEDIRCYGNINRAVRTRTFDQVVQVAKEAVDAGFERLKFAPFDFLVGARRISHGLELATAVRDAVGTEIELMLDLHNQLSIEEVLAVGDAFVELNPRWLEDVAPVQDVEAHRRVRKELGIPLAAGEFAASIEELRPLVEAGVVDVVMPDVKHAGGARRALQLGQFATQHGVEVSPHNPTGPISTIHTAMLCRALPSYGMLEVAVGETEQRAAIIQPHEQTVSGAYVLPNGSGIATQLATDVAWTSVRKFT